ncbi:MAG: DUF4271 domain-containing protein [bacterium]|nr:DUF4271 domain-containing protein [bacterium]
MLLWKVPCSAQFDSATSLFTFEETHLVPDSLLSGIDYYLKIRKQQQERLLIDDLGQMALTITQDTASYMDTIPKDTLVPQIFKGTDLNIFRNSKANIRKSLLASENPPLREYMNNWFVLAWCFFVLLLLIIFKYSYPLQYYLINRAWYSSLSFREFYDTQTDVFKGSKFFAWFVISQVFSIGVFVLIRVNFKEIKYADITLALLVSAGILSIFILNQWMKFLFSFAFRQMSLSKDYAIIFRINAFLITLVLMPLILFTYFSNMPVLQQSVGLILLISLLLIYGLSLLKFAFSGLFAETQSSLFLILYLCAFEVLPILVLIKSFNSFLF